MSYTAEEFLAIIKPMVIKDMKSNKILASLTAAQALIESNKGNSGLTQKANNLTPPPNVNTLVYPSPSLSHKWGHDDT